MKDQDGALTVALAQADQQVAHVDATLGHLVAEATSLVAIHGETGAWALLARKLLSQLEDRPQFLAEMLSRMAIKAVEHS